MIAEVVDDVFIVVRQGDPLPVGRDSREELLIAAHGPEQLAALSRPGIERQDRRGRIADRVTPVLHGRDEELRARFPPLQVADVRVDLRVPSGLPRCQIELPDLDRSRRARIGVEDDARRLIGRRGGDGNRSLRLLREKDRSVVRSPAPDLVLIERFRQAHVDPSDGARNRRRHVERKDPERALLEVSEPLSVPREKGAGTGRQSFDRDFAPRLRRQHDRLLGLVVATEGKQDPLRVGQPRDARGIDARTSEHPIESQRRFLSRSRRPRGASARPGFPGEPETGNRKQPRGDSARPEHLGNERGPHFAALRLSEAGACGEAAGFFR